MTCRISPASIRNLLAAVCLTAVCAVAAPAARAGQPMVASSIADNQKRVCVHDDNSLSGIAAFASMVGRATIDCALVYSPSADWAQMTNPWYLTDSDPDLNYAAWVSDSPVDDRRQLIISQPLIPDNLAGTRWLDAGAAGGYNGHAKAFARNLVNAGVGDAVIRLAWEMNGTWYPDSIPNTPGGDAKWIQFWRNTVTAMRSVPGAHFLFDWCPNNGYRTIPLDSYYPGDAYVDIIGDDAYDSGLSAPVQAQQNGWSTVLSRPSGLQTVIDFAQSHGKPLSLPEWGVAPTSVSASAGDDPTYVAGIANIVESDDVAYQSYFYNHDWATQLQTGPLSLAAYSAAFGDGGYASGQDDGTDIDVTGAPTTPAPPATTTPGTTTPVTPATTTPVTLTPTPPATTTPVATTPTLATTPATLVPAQAAHDGKKTTPPSGTARRRPAKRTKRGRHARRSGHRSATADARRAVARAAPPIAAADGRSVLRCSGGRPRAGSGAAATLWRRCGWIRSSRALG
jgi:hypothetical protein